MIWFCESGGMRWLQWFVSWSGCLIVLWETAQHTCAAHTMCSINHYGPLPGLDTHTNSHESDDKRKRDERYHLWIHTASHTWAFHLELVFFFFQWTPTTSTHSIHIYGSDVLVCKRFPTVPSQQMDLFLLHFLNVVYWFLCYHTEERWNLGFFLVIITFCVCMAGPNTWEMSFLGSIHM